MIRKTVLLVTNLDTRGAEFAAVRDLVAGQEVATILMDVSMEQLPPFPGDITCEEVATAGGMTIEAVRATYPTERKIAVDCMIRGGGAIAQRLYRESKIHGVLGVGGATGTLICTSIMKHLPFGVPKVMASSVGSHPSYVGRYVGTRDIMMLNTVVDVVGLNPLLWSQYANAVGAVCGAVRVAGAVMPGAELGGGAQLRRDGGAATRATADSVAPASDATPTGAVGGSWSERAKAPVIGVTSFGFAERSVERVVERLRESGFEPVPFHAQGRGDRAMDELIRDGMLSGVVDVVTRGVGEELLGGNCAAGTDRILAAAECGLPQVLAPSGLDMLSVGGQPGWQERFSGRAFAVIDELRVEVRTSAEECRQIAGLVAERLNRAAAPYLFLIPGRGWSSLGRAGAALNDPEADAAFADELRRRLREPARVRDVDTDGYSPEFGDACAAAFFEVWAEGQGSA
ncbi:MAG: Tm-1-like ATP-binding domain-containing protein [Actinobacteria bacterium]|nr:Tm-1-like ATP-binding domain-containing protein [Actinomycetota bacterium]